MEKVIKIIKDFIDDNEMRLKTQTGQQSPEYYKTKIETCKYILEKVQSISNHNIFNVAVGNKRDLLVAFSQYLGKDCGIVIFDINNKIKEFLDLLYPKKETIEITK